MGNAIMFLSNTPEAILKYGLAFSYLEGGLQGQDYSTLGACAFFMPIRLVLAYT